MASLGETRRRRAHGPRSRRWTSWCCSSCTSTYPASPENSHLRTIPHLRDLFGCEVGLSDHTMGVESPL